MLNEDDVDDFLDPQHEDEINDFENIFGDPEEAVQKRSWKWFVKFVIVLMVIQA